MATFKDNRGADWVISLDAPTIRMLRTECDLDIADQDGAAYERLAGDPCLLVDVLWVLLREQAAEKGINEVHFAKALVGDAIEAATSALLEARTDFFPPRKRELLLAIAAKNQKLRDLATSQALAKLDNPELEQQALAILNAQMDEAIKDVLIRLSNATGSPASSESAPAD